MPVSRRLIEKINALSPEKVKEVSDFVDSLTARPSAEEQDRMIAEYAAEFGGTEFDLDPALEQAGLECLQRFYEAEAFEK